jgi:predicted TIM-barrel fold metal-dependent hydrolase
MRIDAHQHFWNYSPSEYEWIDEALAALRRNFLPEDLEPEDLTPYLHVALESFGPERLMIESDWPLCTVAASYSQTIDAVLQFLGPCTEEAREKLLGPMRKSFIS